MCKDTSMGMGNLAPQANCYFGGADPRNPELQKTATSRYLCCGFYLGSKGMNTNQDIFLGLYYHYKRFAHWEQLCTGSYQFK